jgi:heme/copper-type cytochrome/quinol oxidase subunit 2
MIYNLIGFIVLYVVGIYGFYFVDHLVTDYTDNDDAEVGSRVVSFLWPVMAPILIICRVFSYGFDKIYEITQEESV